MRASSAKAKGRRLQDSVVLKFRTLFNGILERGDITPAIMGSNGTDVVLSPAGKRLIPFDVECKNVEKLVGVQLQNAIEQAESNSDSDRVPILIFKSNNEPERVILRLDHFLSLVYPNGDVTFSMSDKQKMLVELETLKQRLLNENQKDNLP